MKRLAIIAGAPLLALAVIAGCRGSVDRVYDDPLAAGPEAGLDSGAPGDGGIVKEHSDGSADGMAPATTPATIIVTVKGLEGTGLSLENNGEDDMSVAANGVFPFKTVIAPGKPFKVTVANQPSAPAQTCAVTGGEGTAEGKNVDVLVTCSIATFPVGGTVVGLGAGKSVTLQNNGGNDVTIEGDKPFAFPAVQSGKPFAVTIKSSTPGTTCNVSGGSGTVVTAAVDSVVVNCGANTYTVGGTVTGLAGTIIVTNNAGNDRTITANGGYAFSLPIENGKPYAVAVKTQPAYPPQTQVCTVTNGTGNMGAANVTNVNIACVTNTYTVSGTVFGLSGTGLKLQNKGTNDTTLAPTGSNVPFSFTTKVPSGTTYTVSVATQPSGQTCAVTNAGGTIASANITNVVVNCGTPTPLSQNFDGVTEPALPVGWTTVNLLAASSPATVATKFTSIGGQEEPRKSNPNSAFIENVQEPRDVALVSPSFTVSSASAKLTFWHRYYTEGGWDGAVLEIAVGGVGAPWQDIITAGGSFNAGSGYTGPLENDGTSTLGGRNAWSGGPKNADVSVNLPANIAGKSIQLRWRWASDNGSSEDGWWVDDIVVTN